MFCTSFRSIIELTSIPEIQKNERETKRWSSLRLDEYLAFPPHVRPNKQWRQTADILCISLKVERFLVY